MALDLNGSNQYLNASGLTLGGADFSVAATIQIDSLKIGAGMLSAAGSANWFLQLGGAPVYPISFYGADAPSSPSTGQVYRIVGTYTHSASTTRLYVNGVLTATSAPSNSIASNSGIDIGRRGDGVYFDGMIAEVGVWKGLVLSAANAREYALGYTPDQIRPDKLAGYWELTKDDDYRDLAGARTLTAFNSPGWRTHPRMIGRTMAQVGQSMATVPSAPTFVSASAVSASQINTAWSTPSSNGGVAITGYSIQRRSPSGSGDWTTIVEDTGTTDANYSDTGLSASTNYGYRFAAINSVGVGAYSIEASDTTEAEPEPEPPPQNQWTTQSGMGAGLGFD